MTDSRPWLRRFHPAAPGAPRLVLFPHAGGAASCFHAASAALAPAVDVLAVQYPGRQDRHAEPLVDDLLVLADRLAAVLDADVTGPVVFFGHSMGASLAFEVARRLGSRVRGLVVSARRAPSAPRAAWVHELGDDALLADVRRLGGTDTRVLEHPRLARMVLPVLRNDYRAAETYHRRPGPDVSCPILALVGDRDPKVPEAEARRWAAHTSGEFELKTFAGGHFYVDDHRAAVDALLGERLTRWAGEPSGPGQQ
ncbi:Surfactin synthase thioesterase subunit [Amycolatopsis pretoriensis]|uniref:Surfactin synthase thioesterase subunit n=1 Tax=Amycolatopsis pretoriensis TaxID=218821 RepID=A0A1H5QQ10_9PSEU|nr:alpha/beta fold hydrolase [Amycolatopsis pretoriensis]SEF27277.1 Surfactin synthase thioesterase subunit [Amycolatopsis pretoriensis]